MNMTRLDLIDVDALLSLENYFDNNPQIHCPFAQCTNIAYECYGYTAFNPSWFCMKRDVFNTIITQGYFSYNSPMGGTGRPYQFPYMVYNNLFDNTTITIPYLDANIELLPALSLSLAPIFITGNGYQGEILNINQWLYVVQCARQNFIILCRSILDGSRTIWQAEQKIPHIAYVKFGKKLLWERSYCLLTGSPLLASYNDSNFASYFGNINYVDFSKLYGRIYILITPHSGLSLAALICEAEMLYSKLRQQFSDVSLLTNISPNNKLHQVTLTTQNFEKIPVMGFEKWKNSFTTTVHLTPTSTSFTLENVFIFNRKTKHEWLLFWMFIYSHATSQYYDDKRNILFITKIDKDKFKYYSTTCERLMQQLNLPYKVKLINCNFNINDLQSTADNRINIFYLSDSKKITNDTVSWIYYSKCFLAIDSIYVLESEFTQDEIQLLNQCSKYLLNPGGNITVLQAHYRDELAPKEFYYGKMSVLDDGSRFEITLPGKSQFYCKNINGEWYTYKPSSKYAYLEPTIRQMSTNGHSEAEIAKKCGISIYTLRQLKRRWDIRSYRKSNPRRNGLSENIMKLYSQGLTISTIAKILKVAPGYVKRRLNTMSPKE